MARYIDGFVLVAKKSQLPAYRRLASQSAKIWKKYGALEYVEAVGDDLHPKGVILPFPKLIKTKPGEAVIFSFIIYKSRAHRDAVNKKVMRDPFMSDMDWKKNGVPFDMKRVATGGFKALVDA